jgi:hypothetical protein
MSLLIFDFGSGETCKNDKHYVKRMIDELLKIKTGRHEVMIKWQLFVSVPAPVKALDHDVFDFRFQICHGTGRAHVRIGFDKPSLDFLLGYQGLV